MTESIALRQEIADEATTAESRLQLAKVALEQAQSQEAESLARAASEILDRQKALSDAAEAYAILALALLAEGKNADAQTSADRALTLSRQSEDVMAGFEASLAAASVQVSARKIDAAAQVLETVQTEARRYGFTEYELEARLSLGKLGVQSEKAAAARAHLRQLENEARGKGFLLIARKAGAALRNSAPHVQ